MPMHEKIWVLKCFNQEKLNPGYSLSEKIVDEFSILRSVE
ncbi:hypothetical protein Rhal01_03682 [Rubritalea halochordaticola]|uniref:Uncharacterized protein n=1 Tax=Rubritalea halochordaticola TaxID=714537 RepID=A0ABP9V4A0_9BACT